LTVEDSEHVCHSARALVAVRSHSLAAVRSQTLRVYVRLTLDSLSGKFEGRMIARRTVVAGSCPSGKGRVHTVTGSCNPQRIGEVVQPAPLVGARCWARLIVIGNAQGSPPARLARVVPVPANRARCTHAEHAMHAYEVVFA